ncbi:hypothetical protein TNCV_4702841 [Trichonephila clavipes]|nr:hypothetical protein TNCV_4702841 [Trichonephila clavipes]
MEKTNQKTRASVPSLQHDGSGWITMKVVVLCSWTPITPRHVGWVHVSQRHCDCSEVQKGDLRALREDFGVVFLPIPFYGG